MLPAHGYPRLKQYPHLAGNFGTAWQNQQQEFDALPAPILFTTNCLMPPRPSYADRVYTTSVVGYKGLRHITADEQGHNDFTPLIEQAPCSGRIRHRPKHERHQRRAYAHHRICLGSRASPGSTAAGGHSQRRRKAHLSGGRL